MNNGKVRSRDEIMACFKDGQTIAIGGQGGVYMPWNLVDMLAATLRIRLSSSRQKNGLIGVGRMAKGLEITDCYSNAGGINYGEEVFYLMHRAALEVLSPDNAGYSVDSMCIGGYLEKDGIKPVNLFGSAGFSISAKCWTFTSNLSFMNHQYYDTLE